MSAVSSKRAGYAVLTVMVGTLGFYSVASARNGLPPIHESSISNVAAAPPPAPAFSERQLPLEQRLIRLERMVDNRALLEMLSRIEDMQSEVQMMRGELEMQRHEFEGIKQRQRDLYLDIDRRMLALEKSASSALAPPLVPTAGFAPRAAPANVAVQPAVTPPMANTARSASSSFASMPPVTPVVPVLGGGSGQPAAAPVPTVAAIDPLQEQSAYQQALNILREGRYDEAIVAFQSFLTRFQGSQYAGNAQYWIGEANYVSLRYPLAVEEFQKVIASYPESAKVSDSLLKIGYTFYELKAWEQARQALGTLVERFPKTTAAQLADNRLHRMKLEGH
ncbi:TPR repeat containing exported protein; Putative periplasmic protein contains a protein prenylyltransferase domain [hydrothermal vent metagenome]|uniref:TPR repeat containing exported protein Putative periplasmic protein contains a protein prenylyltransferase domain n=1 Tax=hydrothermal vent metagenome TaxID=652676 RepID=A0A3B1A880_9ZZZZ